MRLTPRTEPAERVPFFYIGDTEYTIPKHPGANIALEYMEILAEDGAGQKAEARAYTYLFQAMCPDGYKALKEYGDLKIADLGQLIGILVKHSMGALEVPKEQPSA